MKRIFIAATLISLAAGCSDRELPARAKSWNMESTPISATFIKQYEAIYRIDYSKMGFPPLPTNGMAEVETIYRDTWAMEYSPPNYDVMLHFYDDPPDYMYTSRGVGLKTNGEQYLWISEQQSFHGPKLYTTVDGTLNEQITLTRENEQVAVMGTNLTGTCVTYSGPDARLVTNGQHAFNLSLQQVAPILREWGYDYNTETAQQSGPAYPPQGVGSADP